jgi:hypothetical protein
MIDILKDKSFRITFLLTFLYLCIGFMFLHFELVDYGWLIFVLFPLSLGVAIGGLPVRRWTSIAVFLTIVTFLILLYGNAMEGMICIIMSIPIIVPLIYLGTKINKRLTEKGILKQQNNMPALVLPIFVLLFGSFFETLFGTKETQIIEVKTERIYPYPCNQVYDAIKSVDTLIAEKPFLMKLDLPIPQKCILEKEAVGGLRTCYFSGGTITERITQLEKNRVLKMDVIDYKLTGRKWLGFKEAIYYFEPVDNNYCKMTRITTYTSTLKPRIYWQPLEKLGIEQEHQYVFDNLNNDLQRLSLK